MTIKLGIAQTRLTSGAPLYGGTDPVLGSSSSVSIAMLSSRLGVASWVEGTDLTYDNYRLYSQAFVTDGSTITLAGSKVALSGVSYNSVAVRASTRVDSSHAVIYFDAGGYSAPTDGLSGRVLRVTSAGIQEITYSADDIDAALSAEYKGRGYGNAVCFSDGRVAWVGTSYDFGAAPYSYPAWTLALWVATPTMITVSAGGSFTRPTYLRRFGSCVAASDDTSKILIQGLGYYNDVASGWIYSTLEGAILVDWPSGGSPSLETTYPGSAANINKAQHLQSVGVRENGQHQLIAGEFPYVEYDWVYPTTTLVSPGVSYKTFPSNDTVYGPVSMPPYDSYLAAEVILGGTSAVIFRSEDGLLLSTVTGPMSSYAPPTRIDPYGTGNAYNFAYASYGSTGILWAYEYPDGHYVLVPFRLDSSITASPSIGRVRFF